MNNTVFRKTIKNIRNHGNIKLITSKRTRNCSVSKPDYHRAKFFFWAGLKADYLGK